MICSRYIFPLYLAYFCFYREQLRGLELSVTKLMSEMIHNEPSARQYLEEKHILQLVQALTTAIAYSKPDDPVPFLLKTVQQLKEARDNGSSVLVCFTEDDIKALFTRLDPFNKGKISREQLEGGLLNFGTTKDLIPKVIGDEQGPFDLEQTIKYINEGVKQTLFP